jgi:pimeloyl-ACP methyl ester carboxylesterase
MKIRIPFHRLLFDISSIVLTYYLLIGGGVNEVFLGVDVLRRLSGGFPSPLITITQSALLALMHSVFYDQALVTPEMIDRYWELNRRPGMLAATVMRFALPADTEPARHLGDIKMLVLILWGREDKLLPVGTANLFKAALPQAKLILYDKCGHVPMEERADQSAADLLAFVARDPTPS